MSTGSDEMRKGWFDWAYLESGERSLIMGNLDIHARKKLMDVWFEGYAKGKEWVE